MGKQIKTLKGKMLNHSDIVTHIEISTGRKVIVSGVEYPEVITKQVAGQLSKDEVIINYGNWGAIGFYCEHMPADMWTKYFEITEEDRSKVDELRMQYWNIPA